MKFLLYGLLVLPIIFRFFTTRPTYSDGEKIRTTTQVLSEPIRYETSQYLKIAGLKVYLPLFPEISYGDNVVIEGVVDSNKLRSPKLISVVESKNFTSRFRNGVLS